MTPHGTARRLLLPIALVAAAAACPPLFAGDVELQPAMGDPLAGLTADELARFLIGADAYDHSFSVEEGLGPTFNQSSCGQCHSNPFGGPGSVTVTRAGMATKGGFDSLEDWGGSLFQQEAIHDDCREEVPLKANVIAQRVTIGMLGYGLVEAISDADILANADPTDSNGDGITGVAHMVEAVEDDEIHVGRFGWKAQAPTMMTFSADASVQELGITNPFFPEENDPNGIFPPELADCDDVADPEQGMGFLMELTDFQRFLAAPPQTPKSGMTGEALFNEIGCNACHVASFTTPDDDGLEDAIRNKTVRPYSDFLLHDMGAGADFIPAGDAGGRELKTPPLQGMRDRDPMWHDGRVAAGTLSSRIKSTNPGTEGVIFWHDQPGSEAQPSAQLFFGLSNEDQDKIVAFLGSLGRREFDWDGDNVVNAEDFHGFGEPDAFFQCYGGAGYDADSPCAVHDLDQDGDVDDDDYSGYLAAYSGDIDDCNANGVFDLTDILENTSDDVNTNGVPDECECLADTNGSGEVNVEDLVNVILAWGECGPPCPEDTNADGQVNVEDLVNVILAWGPCSG